MHWINRWDGSLLCLETGAVIRSNGSGVELVPPTQSVPVTQPGMDINIGEYLANLAQTLGA